MGGSKLEKIGDLAKPVLALFGFPEAVLNSVEVAGRAAGLISTEDDTVKRWADDASQKLTTYAAENYQDVGQADKENVNRLVLATLSRADRVTLLRAGLNNGPELTKEIGHYARSQADLTTYWQDRGPLRDYIGGLANLVSTLLRTWVRSPEIRTLTILEGVAQSVEMASAIRLEIAEAKQIGNENHKILLELRKTIRADGHKDIALPAANPDEYCASADDPELTDRSVIQRLVDGYRSTVRDLAPRQLIGRDDLVADLWAFARATRPNSPSWRVLLGGPWAGKTALMATLALTPPSDVRCVYFFIIGREESARTRESFIRQVMPQLAHVAGDSNLPPWFSVIEGANLYREHLRAAAEKASNLGQRLLLLVDGLDEDAALRYPELELGSIGALLPATLPTNVRVLSAARPNPRLPSDVPTGHPLRQPEFRREISSSAEAEVARIEALADLRELVTDPVGRDCAALIAASGSALTAVDLAELTSGDVTSVEALFDRRHGRTFLPTGFPGEIGRAFRIGHDKLERMLISMLGSRGPDLDDPDEDKWREFRYLTLSNWRRRVVAWGLDWKLKGWPAETPGFLLDSGFVTLLEREFLLDELVEITASRRRTLLMRDRYVAASTVVSQLHTALRALQRTFENSKDEMPDLVHLIQLVLGFQEATRYTSDGAALFAKVLVIRGNSEYALTLAEASRDPAGLLASLAWAAGSQRDGATCLKVFDFYQSQFGEYLTPRHLAQFALAFDNCSYDDEVARLLDKFNQQWLDANGWMRRSGFFTFEGQHMGDAWLMLLPLLRKFGHREVCDELQANLRRCALGQTRMAAFKRGSSYQVDYDALAVTSLTSAAWLYLGSGDLETCRDRCLESLSRGGSTGSVAPLLAATGFREDEWLDRASNVEIAEFEVDSAIWRSYRIGDSYGVGVASSEALDLFRELDGRLWSDVASEFKEEIMRQIPLQSGLLHLKFAGVSFPSFVSEILNRFIMGPWNNMFAVGRVFADDLFSSSDAAKARVIDFLLRVGRLEEAYTLVISYFYGEKRDRMLARVVAVSAIRNDYASASKCQSGIVGATEVRNAHIATHFYGILTSVSPLSLCQGSPCYLDADPEAILLEKIARLIVGGSLTGSKNLPHNQDGTLDGLLAAWVAVALGSLPARGVGFLGEEHPVHSALRSIHHEGLRVEQAGLIKAYEDGQLSFSLGPKRTVINVEKDPLEAVSVAGQCTTADELVKFSREFGSVAPKLADWASCRAFVLSKGESFDASALIRTRARDLIEALDTAEHSDLS